MGPNANIYILDDHPLIREAVSEIITGQEGLDFAGGTGASEQALRALSSLSVDLIILDLSLGAGLEGLHLVARLRERFPNLRILINSMYDESLFAERCLRSGAHGYVNKRERSSILVEAIRAILRGEMYLSAELQKRLMLTYLQGGPTTRMEDLLTDRELEVFQMLGWGFNTQEISRRLGLSKSTIETHRGNLKVKLSVTSSTHLIRKAVQWVLYQQTEPPDSRVD